MIFEIAEDTGCSQQRALYWALRAKNLLSNNNGYSPHQLIYGKNFNFLSILTNNLPALNEEVSSRTAFGNLQTLHAAWKAFVADNSNQIKRALKHNIQRYNNDVQYENGDRVYFKSGDDLQLIWGQYTDLGTQIQKSRKRKLTFCLKIKNFHL